MIIKILLCILGFVTAMEGFKNLNRSIDEKNWQALIVGLLYIFFGITTLLFNLGYNYESKTHQEVGTPQQTTGQEST